MTEFKGTPGPWMVSGQNLDSIVDSNGDVVALACRYGENRLCREESEVMANACLIASARYLLESLIGLLPLAEMYRGSKEYKKAEEAIKAALGDK
ncbi:hypothetical protein [Methylomonas sp. CM2]|uniref:hypothetical protein n=1 Tax=Methylomonas sp. CM2 TaxID=3417647 RepID=UPI003CF01E2E